MVDKSPKSLRRVCNALTIDVEDYFHVEAFRHVAHAGGWDKHTLRVKENVERLLEIFESKRIKSTFFVLGWIAERMPEIVRDIKASGHEIACHGHSHAMIRNQTREEFREDVRRAKATLEDIINQKVVGYRAPTFSITNDTRWALDILAEEDFQYDSSIFPVRHDRYGIPDWNRWIETVRLSDSRSIIEAPPATIRIWGRNLPAGGGGYFRLAPLWLSVRAIKRINAEGHPAILYLHPWEIDPGQPRVALPPLSRFRHYVNLHSTERKLRSLLPTFRFTRMRDMLGL